MSSPKNKQFFWLPEARVPLNSPFEPIIRLSAASWVSALKCGACLGAALIRYTGLQKDLRELCAENAISWEAASLLRRRSELVTIPRDDLRAPAQEAGKQPHVYDLAPVSCQGESASQCAVIPSIMPWGEGEILGLTQVEPIQELWTDMFD